MDNPQSQLRNDGGHYNATNLTVHNVTVNAPLYFGYSATAPNTTLTGPTKEQTPRSSTTREVRGDFSRSLNKRRK